ncbi:MAG: hypothetical protein WC554_10090 [Clostridia bacterium]
MLFERLVQSSGGSPLSEAKAEISGDRLCVGIVAGFDYEKQTMSVNKISGGNTERIENVRLNSQLTEQGYGFRVTPIVGVTTILMYRITNSDYLHVGYYYGDMSSVISDNKNEKENSTEAVMLRYLDGGEVQIVSLRKNEIYLSNDGSVLLKAQYGASLKLDNILHRLDGNFANMKYEMDGVRIRSGNVIRPTVPDTYEEDFIMIKDEEVTKESDLNDDEDYSELLPIREFTVQVGTEISENGIDEDPPLSPSLGYFSLANKIVNEKGEEVTINNNGEQQSINFRLKINNGRSIAVTEDGSLFLLDDTTGNFVKFGVGDNTDTSFRAGDNLIILNNEDGVYIKQATGSSIKLDKDGNVQINDGDETNTNTIIMEKGKGITLTTANDLILSANKIILLPKDNVYVGDPTQAADNLITLGGFGNNVYGVHTHPFTNAFGAPSITSPPTQQPTAANSAAKGVVVT